MIIGQYPQTRMRRNRTGRNVRDLVAEHALRPADLLQPVFVLDQADGVVAIDHLAGIKRYGLNPLIDYVGQIQKAGILGIFLFSHIATTDRDAQGSYALRPEGIIPRAARLLRKNFPDLMLIADVALDCYTDHGHDGIIIDNQVDNDETIATLCQQAQVLAEAGCDSLSPSDMMDGRIGAIRHALDAQGYQHVRLMSYACKYASCFYGPFRDAVGSQGLLHGDKRHYQMDPANAEEGLHEAAMDIAEGADMLIVKPGLAYLDMVYRVKTLTQRPVLSYQVSGEYAMLHHAAQQGILDWEASMLETLLAFKRAGADAIISYAAHEFARKIS